MCSTHFSRYTDFFTGNFPWKGGTVQRHVQVYSFIIQCVCMGRIEYVCATCEEHFTRRYSATRHNITIHNNRGEIVSLLEYLVGRSSGRYQAGHPFWYRRPSKEKSIHNFGDATSVADSMGDAFRPPDLQSHQHSLEQQDRCQQQSLSPSIPPSSAAIHDHLWMCYRIQLTQHFKL